MCLGLQKGNECRRTPPQDFDININNKPNIYSPQCPKTYKNVCVHSLRNMVVFWQLWRPFGSTQKLSRMTSKLNLGKILFHILIFQHNSIKTHQILHVNVTIAYKDNDVPGNVQSRPGHVKRHKNEVIVCVENGKLYNKQQHVHNLLLAMTNCNCLETKTHQPQDDGIVEKWTQSMDFAMRKWGSKNDWQN